MTHDEYLGSVALFAADFAPKNFMLCDGRLLNIEDHPTLYSIIGNYFGGDGRTNFGIPDFRGRNAICAGENVEGMWPVFPGESAGREKHTFYYNSGDLPAHSHTASIAGRDLDALVSSSIDAGSLDVRGTLRCNTADGNRGPYEAYPGNPTAYPSALTWSDSSNTTMAPNVIADATIHNIEVSTSVEDDTIDIDITGPDDWDPVVFDNRALYCVLDYVICVSGAVPPHA